MFRAVVLGLLMASCAALPDPDGCEIDCYVCIATEFRCSPKDE